MDECDKASAVTEIDLQDAIERHNRTREPDLIPTGFCYWCESDIHPGHLFCDLSCMEDWQRERDARRRNGS